MSFERNEGILALKNNLDIDVNTQLIGKSLEVCFEDRINIACTQDGDVIRYDAAISVVPYEEGSRLELLRTVMKRAAAFILESDDIVYLDEETLEVRAVYCFSADGASPQLLVNELREFAGRVEKWIESVSDTSIAVSYSPHQLILAK